MSSTAPRSRVDRTRFAAWRERVSARMARSSRVFLIGLVMTCGFEVLMDWNQTIIEINVLRSAIRQKGENYVGILSKAGDDELASRDRAGLERLSHGVFDDVDAVYVRFTDAEGAVVWDKVKPDFAEAFRKAGHAEVFSAHYAQLMDRDTKRLLRDPAELKAHVAASRYRDFAQAWTDATARVVASVLPPKPEAPAERAVVYQDRLRDDKRQKDDTTSYAIGTVLGEDGRDLGTVLVAFDLERTNASVRTKYLKFAGLCTLFVVLILVQNTVSRRNKLWRLNLQARYSRAKEALRQAMPIGDTVCGALVATGAVDQAAGPVDGMVWTAVVDGESLLALVVDPDGDGVDAAAVGLHVVRSFLGREGHEAPRTLDEELRAVGAAAAGIPLARPVGAMLVRVDARSGAYEALCGDLAHLRILGGPVVESPELEPIEAEAPEGIVGPLRLASGVLGAGQSFIALCSASGARKTLSEPVATYLARSFAPGTPAPVQDAAIWARGKVPALAESDIAVVAVTRAPQI